MHWNTASKTSEQLAKGLPAQPQSNLLPPASPSSFSPSPDAMEEPWWASHQASISHPASPHVLLDPEGWTSNIQVVHGPCLEVFKKMERERNISAEHIC